MKSCSINSGNKQSPTCEVVHEKKLTSEISLPTDSFLVQLVEHWGDDPDVVGSNSTGKYILFYVTLDLSDNLTEMHQIGLA